MNYISTQKNTESIPFKEAVINGLTKNGGLYIPQYFPILSEEFYQNIDELDNIKIANEVLYPFVEGSLNKNQLNNILEETLNFKIPVTKVNDQLSCLELYHGPTQAFKDVGARFMSRCLSHFYSNQDKKVTILVATSGDTGSAVANGFYKVPGVEVKILFPKGKVSSYQEYQMTILGENIHAIEVDGTFDDCQKLVKKALNDKELRGEKSISSANSINVARLLPQMVYYFFAYKQIKKIGKEKKIVVSVPSGNLGNLTAGLFTKKMGLPIYRFIAAHNLNDTFCNYLTHGTFHPKKSILTYSNAMDVGNPSNFERILHLYKNDKQALKKDLQALSFNNASTLKEIKDCYNKNKYILDPHGAIGKLALSHSMIDDEYGLFLETAHPNKFSNIIQKAIPEFKIQNANLDSCNKTLIQNDYKSFISLIN